MVSAEISARRHADLFRAEYASDVLSRLDLPRPQKSKPLSFRVPVKWRGMKSTRGIESDEIIDLDVFGRAVKPKSAFMVEIDRENETIQPGENALQSGEFWRQSSIFKKFLLYAHAFDDNLCRPFDIPNFRVLMVTSTPSHMKSMQKCENNIFGPGALLERSPGFILYTCWDDIAGNDGNVLAMPWQDRKGKERFLFK